MLKRLTYPLILLAAFGCRTVDSSKLQGDESSRSGEYIGVLMASHGDIDDYKTELEFYVKTAFRKNVGIPFPFWFRPAIEDVAYKLSVNNVTEQYKKIGPTHYRANAKLQMDAITAAFQSRGVRAKAYYGANFTHPLIEETLEEMQKDGVTKLIVFNKGAQFSWASAGENIGDVREYMKQHPEWDVEAIGFHQYSRDPRFHKVWKDAILHDAKDLFPGVPTRDVCLFIGSHGLPVIMTDRGDPAVSLMKESVAWLKENTPEYPIYHGFLNDDFIPGAKWASPRSSVMAQQLRDEGCKNVLMDGRLSFTNHHRATLYDLNIEARGILEDPNGTVKGKKDPNWKKPKVVLAPQFDGNPAFGELIADLTLEAFEGQGDFEAIKHKGSPMLPRPSYPVKSVYIEY